jgi:hypothetical protein
MGNNRVNVRYETLNEFYQKIISICNTDCKHCDFSHMCSKMEINVNSDKYTPVIRGSLIRFRKGYRDKSDSDRTIIKHEFIKRCLSGQEKFPEGWDDIKLEKY